MRWSVVNIEFKFWGGDEIMIVRKGNFRLKKKMCYIKEMIISVSRIIKIYVNASTHL